MVCRFRRQQDLFGLGLLSMHICMSSADSLLLGWSCGLGWFWWSGGGGGGGGVLSG
jgi:hypothetical protein